jgi:hypothetical protein
MKCGVVEIVMQRRTGIGKGLVMLFWWYHKELTISEPLVLPIRCEYLQM